MKGENKTGILEVLLLIFGIGTLFGITTTILITYIHNYLYGVNPYRFCVNNNFYGELWIEVILMVLGITAFLYVLWKIK